MNPLDAANDWDPSLVEAWQLSCRGKPLSAFRLASSVYDDALLEGKPALRAAAAADLGWYCVMLCYTERGIAFSRMASALWRQSGNKAAEARACATSAWLLAEIDIEAAHEEAMAALDLAQRVADPWVEAFARNALGIVCSRQENFETGLGHAREATRLANEAGDTVSAGRWLANVGAIHAKLAEAPIGRMLRSRHLHQAVAVTRAALNLGLRETDSWAARVCVCNLAEYLQKCKRGAEARALLAQHAKIGGELGPHDQANFLHVIGQTLLAEQRYAEAEKVFQRCIKQCEQSDYAQVLILALRDLATVLARQERFSAAFDTLSRFHDLYVQRDTASAKSRIQIAFIQREMDQFSQQVEAERRRIEELEESNLQLTRETLRLLRSNLEDPLTGLANRRHLDTLMSQLEAGRGVYTLAMIDIDHFKQVNDRFSHSIGDAVLRKVAELLRSALQAPDQVLRYGGEEFTALILTEDEGDAHATCERLRLAVREYEWTTIHPELLLTASIGFATCRETDGPSEALKLADERLYAAKHGGRNRVEPDPRQVLENSLALSDPDSLGMSNLRNLVPQRQRCDLQTRDPAPTARSRMPA